MCKPICIECEGEIVYRYPSTPSDLTTLNICLCSSMPQLKKRTYLC